MGILFYGFQKGVSHIWGSSPKNGLDCIGYNVLLNNIVLLVTLINFEPNPMLVNINKLKPYQFITSKVQLGGTIDDRSTMERSLGEKWYK